MFTAMITQELSPFLLGQFSQCVIFNLFWHLQNKQPHHNTSNLQFLQRNIFQVFQSDLMTHGSIYYLEKLIVLYNISIFLLASFHASVQNAVIMYEALERNIEL